MEKIVKNPLRVKIVEWKDAGPRHKVSATDAYEELNRIRSVHGKLEPAIIVEEASDESNVLHDEFEWDDTKAASRYRIVQARSLVNSLRVTFAEGPQQVNPFMTIKPENSKTKQYMPIKEVIEIPDYRNQALADALRDMNVFTQKYRHLTELAELFDSIEKAKKKLKSKLKN